MILNEENSNSSSSSSAATTTNTKSPMMSKLKTHNSTPKLAHKSMIYPKADASKTVNEAMRMMNGSDTSLKNNSSSICSSISSSSSTSSSSSSTNSSIYQNHNNHTHNNPDCYIHAPKSSQTLIKYVHPTTTSVVSGGVAVVKQKSLSPANICLSKSSHGRSNGDATNGNTTAAVNPNSVTYRHKSVNVIERTPQIDETTNNPMKLVYNYNANRLSSYDNDVFSNFCSSGQHMTDPGVIINDEMMPTMTTNTLAAVNREQEYMNTMSMLPMKQRAASQSISTQTNKSTNGGTNVFSRALNFARQKASPSVNRAGNGTEQGNSKSSSSSTWRSKLTKYLTQSSSPPPPSSSVPPSSSSPSTASSSQHHQRRKRANRRKTIQTSMELNPHRSKLIYHPSSAHNYHHHHYNDFDDEDMDDEPYQDGCDILLDENDDIYSSYHLSRRQTATTNNLITATIKQPHHYNYQHHQQQHNQQQSKLLSISSGLLSLSSSASSTTSSAANNNNNNHNSVAPTTNALSSASVASSSAASDFIGVVAAANSRQSPQIVDLTSKSTRSPSQNFSKSSKQRINNGFNSLRRILKLNNNNPTSNHYHNNNSSNQTLKEPIALNTPPLNHRLAKRTSTLDYSKSMMSTHQPQLQQQQQQQQQSTSKNMFTMTLNRHMSGACGSSASCEEHKSTMVKKKDKLKKQMSFSAVSSSMKVDMIANNRCATSAAVAARSAHSMSLTDDALSHVNNTNQAQNSGNSSRVMNMLRVYKNVLSKISRTPSHCQTPAATSTSTTPASSNTLSLMNCANPRSSHHNHNTGTTPGSKEGQNHPITNSVVSFTSAVNLKPNSSSCLQIQMPIATKQLAAQLNCSGRTNGGGSGGNNTSTNSSSSSSSILFPVMVAPTLPYQQPIQIVSQHHSVENNNKLVSLANSPKTFATIHNPSSAHMMSESSNGTATLYENNTGGYRSVSVHIEATSTRRKNSNTKSPSYDVEEDLACDLEVASFFDKKRRGDVEYGAEEEYDDDDGDVGGAQEEPMMGDNDDYYSTTTYEPPAIINGVGGGGENGMLNYNLDYDDDDFNQTEDDEEHDIDDDDDDGQDEEDSQNLDYLVRQLVAEASLSNLNINMDSRKQQPQQQNQLYENRSSFPDLNRSEFVDDDNLDSSSGENHQQQQRRQVVMDSESELSLVEVEIPSGIMTTTTAASQQQQRRRPSSSYSRLESLTSKLNANVTQPSQPAPPIITDSPHSQSGAVKLEKRIRLNYRKQPNLNNVNLLNFGTLC